MERGSRKRELGVSLGERLIDENYRILSGGLGDLAPALAEGAHKSKRYLEGDLIAILPGFDPSIADAYSDIIIATGLDYARNMVVANSDAVVAIGGGAGTLSEIAYAWALKRLILAYRVDGWSGKLAGTRIDSRVRYPKVSNDQVYPVDTADEVISYLRNLLPKYNRRHTGITVRKEKDS
jgi:uncharacterized protein (TIGR00725 family)